MNARVKDVIYHLLTTNKRAECKEKNQLQFSESLSLHSRVFQVCSCNHFIHFMWPWCCVWNDLAPLKHRFCQVWRRINYHIAPSIVVNHLQFLGFRRQSVHQSTATDFFLRSLLFAATWRKECAQVLRGFCW
jgi:hypothetical protein